MRVPSGRQAKDGGYYHRFDDSKPRPVYVPARKPVAKAVDCEMEYNKVGVSVSRIAYLSKIIQVSEVSLKLLGVKWSHSENAWLFPMYDGSRKMIGLNRRYENGEKKVMAGTSGGLYLPDMELTGIPVICEGGGDACALLDLGYYPIGRFTSSSCVQYIKDFCKNNNVHRVIILAQNDCIKVGGKRPGQEGAKSLKKELGLMSIIVTVPSPLKDCRDLLTTVGLDSARHIINDAISNKVWTRG